MNRKLTALMLLFALLAAASLVLASAKKEKASELKESVLIQTSTRDVRSPLDDTYQSTDTPVEIPDGPGGQVTSSITVNDAYNIADLNVLVNITHTYTSDLQIYLSKVDGPEIRLFNHRGGGGDNITNCTFDDEATASISAGVAPFTGSWRPEQALTVFDGLSVTGTWDLRILDDAALDVGTLTSWSLITTRADANSGDINGVVTDQQSGSPLEFAKVTVVGVAGEICTGTDGSYSFTLISPGQHEVRVTHGLYAPFSQLAMVPAGGFVVVDAALVPWPNFETESFQSTGANVPISDLDSAFKTLIVSGSMISSDIDVTVNIDHTYVGDLDVWVENPAGDRTQLIAHNGGNNGVNYEATRLDDDACLSVTEGEAPYTGTFIPVEDLAVLEGSEIQGTWRLVVYDFFEADEGAIVGWSVHASAFDMVSADEPREGLPLAFSFDGNYPNPFNASTEFKYSLDRQADVSLKLYNVAGQEVARVFSGTVQAGSHSIFYDASALSTGIYFANLSANGVSKTHKIVLLK